MRTVERPRAAGAIDLLAAITDDDLCVAAVGLQIDCYRARGGIDIKPPRSLHVLESDHSGRRGWRD